MSLTRMPNLMPNDDGIVIEVYPGSVEWSVPPILGDICCPLMLMVIGEGVVYCTHSLKKWLRTKRRADRMCLYCIKTTE